MPDNHCDLSDIGIPRDLNEELGYPGKILHPYCVNGLSMKAGTFYTPLTDPWYTNASDSGVPIEYPDDYTPSKAEPMDDFLSKLVINYIVDEGTRQEKTYTFDAVGNTIINPWYLIYVGDNPLFRHVWVLGTLHPESVGTHAVHILLSMTARHCDGLGIVESDNCIEPGVFYDVIRTFEVTSAN